MADENEQQPIVPAGIDLPLPPAEPLPPEIPRAPEVPSGYALPPQGHPAPPGGWGAPPPMGQPQGGSLQGLIPTKNPSALAAYYCGVFSIVCGILAPIALVLGLMGLSQIKKQSGLPGKAHAWVGIAMGGIFTLIYIGVFVAIAVTAAAPR